MTPTQRKAMEQAAELLERQTDPLQVWSLDDARNIAAALREALAEPAPEPTQRQLETSKRQWESWKGYALELAEKLAKYEGGAPMVLNADPVCDPAPQAQTTCHCRWEGGVQVRHCALHQSYEDAIYDWAERAKTAEAKVVSSKPAPMPLLTDDEIHDVWMIARVANEFPTVYALEFAHSRIEQLETALSECRDAMPSPAPGERQEQSWSEAIGDPLAVPAYVKAGIAAFATPPAQTPPRLTDGQMLRMWIDSTGHVDAYGSAIETAVRRQFLGRDE